MPSEGLEVPYRLATLGEEREATMPKIVESNGGEAGSIEERFVVTVHDVLGVERSALAGGEHEP